MTRTLSDVTVGMAVLGADAVPVGHVEDVADGVLRIRLQRDIYIPAEIIFDVTAERVALKLRTDGVIPVIGERKAGGAAPTPSETSQVCSACGARLAGDPTQPVLHKGDARVCMGCWSHLSAPEVEGVVQEVALRGVPLS